MKPRLETTLSSFADRLFVSGGADPGDAALALPPARLAIYRSMLHGNYRSMLRFGLTCAFRLMDHELAAAAGADGLPRDTEEVIDRYLQTSPSRTHSSREIAERFSVFLPQGFPKLVARRPDLVDLMTLERAELRAMHAADDPGRLLDAEEIESIARGSLDDLLARTIVRAPSASVLRLAHPVVALRAELDHDHAPPAMLTGEEHALVGRTRPPKFVIEFASQPSEAAVVCGTAKPGVPVVAEELAVAWSEALPAAFRERDDAWRASAFATAVVTGLRTGFFRAA